MKRITVIFCLIMFFTCAQSALAGNRENAQIALSAEKQALRVLKNSKPDFSIAMIPENNYVCFQKAQEYAFKNSGPLLSVSDIMLLDASADRMSQIRPEDLGRAHTILTQASSRITQSANSKILQRGLENQSSALRYYNQLLQVSREISFCAVLEAWVDSGFDSNVFHNAFWPLRKFVIKNSRPPLTMIRGSIYQAAQAIGRAIPTAACSTAWTFSSPLPEILSGIPVIRVQACLN